MQDVVSTALLEETQASKHKECESQRATHRERYPVPVYASASHVHTCVYRQAGLLYKGTWMDQVHR